MRELYKALIFLCIGLSIITILYFSTSLLIKTPIITSFLVGIASNFLSEFIINKIYKN